VRRPTGAAASPIGSSFAATRARRSRATTSARLGTHAIGKLSGGNIQKALLARELDAQANVAILNKPTYGLDLQNQRLALERIGAAAARGVAVIVISTISTSCSKSATASGHVQGVWRASSTTTARRRPGSAADDRGVGRMSARDRAPGGESIPARCCACWCRWSSRSWPEPAAAAPRQESVRLLRYVLERSLLRWAGSRRR